MKLDVKKYTLGYVPAIDGLRAIAILSVITYHLRATLLPGGYAGVDIFFVISGLVVTGSLFQKQFVSLTSLMSYFYARRLMRLMPALLVMLMVAILAQQLFVPVAWLSGLNKRVALSAFFGGSNIVLAFNDDSYFSPRAALNPFTHTWSLGVEEQFYLAFPFFMYWRQRCIIGRRSDRMPIRILAAATILSLVACGLMSQFERRYAFYLLPARFWELGCGMLLCLTVDQWREPVARWSVALRRLLGLAAGLALLVGLVMPAGPYFPFPLAIFPVAGAALLIVLVCSAPSDAPGHILANPVMVYIGRLSYSLYLWHWPVFVLFRWTIGLQNLAAISLAIGLVVALSLASYHWVERPLRTNARLIALPRLTIVQMQLTASLVAAFCGVGLFLAHDRLSLSVTRNAADWYPDLKRPLKSDATRCQVNQTTEIFAGGTRVQWRAEGCHAQNPRLRVFAVGDSHNWAYAPNYRQFAAETGADVEMFFRTSCGYLRLAKLAGEDSHCPAFSASVTRVLVETTRPGDVIFLPSLRMSRLPTPNSDGEDDTDDWRGEPPRQHGSMVAEARRTIALLTSKGATILFAAPTPLFRSPPYRCSDWFNRDNPICSGGLTMPRAQLEAMRTEVIDDMEEIGREYANVRIWDPFPILCPGELCRALSGDRPLFFDVDHISGHGDDIVYPSFRASLLEASDAGENGMLQNGDARPGGGVRTIAANNDEPAGIEPRSGFVAARPGT